MQKPTHVQALPEMEPTEVNANHFAQVDGRLVSLDAADDAQATGDGVTASGEVLG